MNPMRKEYDLTKLPKWGQAEIVARDRRIKELEQENAALRAIGDNEASSALEPDYLPKAAVLDPYHHKIPVGDGHIRYQFDDSLYLHIDARFIENEYDGDHLYISASRSLEIQPSASNCIRLYVRQD